MSPHRRRHQHHLAAVRALKNGDVAYVGRHGVNRAITSGLTKDVPALTNDQVAAVVLALLCVFGAGILFVAGTFSIRASLQRYYRDVEPVGTTVSGDPIGIKLNGVLTFFFSIYYIQYYFSKIAAWKESGVLPNISSQSVRQLI